MPAVFLLAFFSDETISVVPAISQYKKQTYLEASLLISRSANITAKPIKITPTPVLTRDFLRKVPVLFI